MQLAELQSRRMAERRPGSVREILRMTRWAKKAVNRFLLWFSGR